MTRHHIVSYIASLGLLTICLILLFTGTTQAFNNGVWVQKAGSLNSQTQILSMVEYNNSIYASTYPHGNLFAWDGVSGWVLKAPQNNSQTSIQSMVVYNNSIYGGTSPNGTLVKWNNVSSWVQEAGQLNSQSIRSLVVYNGSIYGGTDGTGLLYVWDNVSSWVQKAAQLNSQTVIQSLVVYNGSLYGGTYPGGKLFKWDNVSAWIEVADTLNSQTQIQSLIVYNGSIYGGTTPNAKLFRWDNVSAWVEVADQLGSQTHIRSMSIYNGSIYAGTNPNGELLEWDNTSAWTKKADQYGVEAYILSTLVYNNTLYGGTDPNGRLFAHEPVSYLYTPANNSVFNLSFPTLTSDIDFYWSLPSGYASQLQVARDIDFNTIVYDSVLNNNTHTLALGAGTYKWRVRFYNIATASYYSWGNVFNFSVVSTPPALTTTSIYGVVYELIDGVQTPISNAKVDLWDNLSMVSYSAITGSNGYFVFSGLGSSKTYNIRATRSDIYKDPPVEYVTTGAGTTFTEHSIMLQRCTSDYDCGNNQHYVSFYVQDVNYQPYPDVSVSVVNDGEVVPIYSGTTGTDGVYQVRLIKNQKYTITFTEGSNTVTWNNYFPSDAYTVTLGTLPLDFNYNITGDNTRFLVRWANLNGSADMTIRNTTGKVLIQTNTSAAGSGQFLFTLQNLTDIYYLSFNASTTSGDVNTSRVYDYRGSSAHPIGRDWSYGSFTVSQEYKNYISYILIIILSGSFGALFAPLGGVILILSTLFFVWYGWLQVAGISTAFVGGIAVIVVVRYLQTKDGE